MCYIFHKRFKKFKVAKSSFLVANTAIQNQAIIKKQIPNFSGCHCAQNAYHTMCFQAEKHKWKTEK